MGCPECSHTSLTLRERLESKKGVASHLVVKCSMCHYVREFYTSNTTQKENDKQGANSFDVNNRIVYAMRACGQGYSGIETFTTLMDMPKPMTIKIIIAKS